MFLKILLLFFVIAFFACAPLRPLTSAEDVPKPPKQDVSDTSAKRQIIDVGIGFEKKSPVIECLGEICKYAGKTYRGSITALSTDSGFAVINKLPIEDYLKGVVPHEIGRLNQDGIEALKAQAVAARTYAYKHLGSRKSQGFDVYADTRDQVYNGKEGEDSLVNAAILATKDLVIKYKGELIEAFYHSTCGGKTESPEVWGQETRPYLVSVADSAAGKAFCELSKYTQWEEKFTRAELAALFQKNAVNAKVDNIFSFNKVEQIFITEKLPSSRIKRLVVFTDKGSFEVYSDKARWLFARDGKILQSSLFTISQDRDVFTITGSGFGHGIGMCQYGVIARARSGQKFDEILKAYYTGVVVER